MNTITTILQFGSSRHCFLTQVDAFNKTNRSKTVTIQSTRDDGIQVYEAEVRTKGKVYFSIHASSPSLLSGDKVELTALFAEKLGLKDADPLLLKVVRASLPSAKRVLVEPLSVDDWEIVEQNSRHIENILLDQIRVIWPGQCFPLWIYRSTCVFMKIVSVEPMSFCVILESSTDLVVSSKTRNNPPKSLGLPGPVASPALPPPRQQTPSQQSSCRSWTYSDQDSSLNETPLDTLEPRPNIRSPSRSPRPSMVNRNRSLKTNTYNAADRPHEHISKPMLRRQSSLMESVMRYVFGFMEKREDFDNLSESDASSGIDYNLEKLPSRSEVLRVQPMRLHASLEDCFPVPKQELHKQIISRLAWVRKRSPTLTDIGGSDWQENNAIPYELFQPSTVYVDIESTKIERELHPFLPRLPYNLIARLERLPSPQEKAEAAAKAKKGKEAGDSKAATTSSTAVSQQKDGKAGKSVAKDAALQSQPPEKVDFEADNIKASCYVRVVLIDRKAGLTDEFWQDAADKLLSEQPLMTGHVIIPDMLRRQLKLDATGSVWLQTGQVEFVIPKKICIYPLSSVPRQFTNDILINAFIKHIKVCANEDHPLVIFQGLFLKFMVIKGHAIEVQITFFGENDLANPKGVSMLSAMNIESVLIQVERDVQNDKMGVINPLLICIKSSDFDPLPLTVKLKHLGGMDSVASLAMAHLKACLGSRPISRLTFMARTGLCHGILLITGPKGSGKSSLSKALCRKMAQVPTMAHIALVDCKTLRGKSVNHIQRILETVFDEAVWRQPAVIVLDNMDAIMPVPAGPESEMNGEAIYSSKNSQVFQSLVKYEMENNSRLGVIATCCSKANLHPSLTSSRGSHIIQETLNIGAPDQEVRTKILECILQQNKCISMETLKTINLQPLAVKTEGFVARDLECLINRSVHNRLIKNPEATSEVTLTQEDFDEVLETFKQVSIRGVPLHKAGDLGWEDIGGLDDIKKSLVETLRWPAKYPELFRNCPLRLRSGIMLYGAPGTGKTLLAGVVAKECDLNFISIKGPELLNKYIGASEQAVRDLFTRAQSAKPCILFFDEFDSIAPKRGHDSTGVTDRVVNQMLTQLDGVEGLQGVYVLAATSRPDLIDPAFLRPGRLDKTLVCGIPTEAERCSILEALTRKMALSYDVQLNVIAGLCENFTGADLKALLYNAQLKAIHEKSSFPLDDDPTMVRIKADDDECPAVRQATEIFDDDFRTKLDEVRGRASSTKTSPEVLTVNEVRRFREASEESSISNQSKTANTKTRVDKGRSGSLDTDLNSSEVSDGQSDSSGREGLAARMEEDLETVSDSGQAKTMESWTSSTDDNTIRASEPSEFTPAPAVPEAPLSPPALPSLIMGEQERLERQMLQSNGSVPEPFDTNLEGLDDVDGLVMSPVLEEPLASSDRSSTFIALTSTPKKQNGEKSNLTAPTLNVDSIEDDAIVNVQDSLPLKMKGSASMNLPDPSQTFPPKSERRKRSYERTQSYSENVRGQLGTEAKTLTVERPVTVFSSLELGLATLSPEDEARYMAMAKEIVVRDEHLFQAANDRRRTSFMQPSRTSRLLEVAHRHLVEAAQGMRPSVNAQERARYLQIYQNFVSSRKAGFEKQKSHELETKRATLA